MSAYVIVEIHSEGPRDLPGPVPATAGKTAQEHGAEVLAAGNWEILDGETGLSSGVVVQFPDHESALRWYNSPEYQQLIDVRGLAMDARFRLLDGLPAPTKDQGDSE